MVLHYTQRQYKNLSHFPGHPWCGGVDWLRRLQQIIKQVERYLVLVKRSSTPYLPYLSRVASIETGRGIRSTPTVHVWMNRIKSKLMIVALLRNILVSRNKA